MTALEFPLIPKQIYFREQPQAARILLDNSIKHEKVNYPFSVTNRTISFDYQKFFLKEIIAYRNALPIADCPVSMTDNKQIHYYTMEALDFLNNNNGINLANYHKHHKVVFDLTSTQEASLDFFHPVLTNWTMSGELKCDTPLAAKFELLSWKSTHQQFKCVLIEKQLKTPSWFESENKNDSQQIIELINW